MVIMLGVLALAVSRVPVSGRDLVEMTEIANISVSPNGSEVAFRTARASVACNCTRTAWFVVPVDGKTAALQIADGGEPIVRAPGVLADEPALWSEDGRSLFFKAMVDGAVQVWRAATDGSGAQAVTRDASDVLFFTLDSDSLRYDVGVTRLVRSAAETAVYDDGMLVDRSTDLAQPVAGALIVDGQRHMQRFTGVWFDRIPFLGDGPVERRMLDLKTGALVDEGKTVAPESPSAEIVIAANGDRAEASRTAGITTVHVTRSQNKTMTVSCTAAPCRSGRVQSVLWRPGEDALLLTVRETPWHDALFTWPIGAAHAQRITRADDDLSDETGRQSSCIAIRSAAVCIAADTTRPPHLVAINLDTGHRTPLFDPNYALSRRIATRAVPQTWSAKGQKFEGLLLLPPHATGPLPLVISYYGCRGFLRGGVGDELPLLPLTEAGVATLCIQQPVLPKPSDAQIGYRVAQQGIETIVRALVRRHMIDPKKIGIHGLSFGSEVAMRMLLHSDMIAAASIASSQLSKAYFWANALPGRDAPEILKSVFGLDWPDRDAAGWQQTPEALQRARLHAPLLMQLPEQEARWSAELYAGALRDHKPIELYAFADEDHIKLQPRHKAAIYTRNLDWFRYWLQGFVDEDAVKASQYRRWHVLSTMRSPAS